MRLVLILFLSCSLISPLKSQEVSLYKAAVDYEPKSLGVNIERFSAVDFELDSGRNELGAFIVLVKQLEYHLKCCHQTYDIMGLIDSSQDTILSIVMNKMGVAREHYREGFGTYHPYKFLKENPDLFSDDRDLKKLFKSIEKIRNNIEKGKYWDRN